VVYLSRYLVVLAFLKHFILDMECFHLHCSHKCNALYEANISMMRRGDVTHAIYHNDTNNGHTASTIKASTIIHYSLSVSHQNEGYICKYTCVTLSRSFIITNVEIRTCLCMSTGGQVLNWIEMFICFPQTQCFLGRQHQWCLDIITSYIWQWFR